MIIVYHKAKKYITSKEGAWGVLFYHTYPDPVEAYLISLIQFTIQIQKV